MRRKIIQIDEEKCNGCGACAAACHEGAIGMVGGKARLLRDDYCDGLGDCLPSCPTGAISFVEREAAEYDEEAVIENRRKREAANKSAEEGAAIVAAAGGHVCPGSQMRVLKGPGASAGMQGRRGAVDARVPASTSVGLAESQLGQWPCQIKLVPPGAPYFDGARLLVAADCTAYAYARMHEEFMRGKVTLIGCPKLDAVDYGEKLTQIIRDNDVKSVTIVRMEVPCCGGLEAAVRRALQDSGKFIPWQVVVVSIDGRILE